MARRLSLDPIAERAAGDYRIAWGAPIYRLACEAMRNEFQHAQAGISRLRSSMRKAFRLRIREDGGGIKPQIAEAGRECHFGLFRKEARMRTDGRVLRAGRGEKRGVPGVTIFQPNGYRKDRARAATRIIRQLAASRAKQSGAISAPYICTARGSPLHRALGGRSGVSKFDRRKVQAVP